MFIVWILLMWFYNFYIVHCWQPKKCPLVGALTFMLAFVKNLYPLNNHVKYPLRMKHSRALLFQLSSQFRTQPFQFRRGFGTKISHKLGEKLMSSRSLTLIYEILVQVSIVRWHSKMDTLGRFENLRSLGKSRKGEWDLIKRAILRCPYYYLVPIFLAKRLDAVLPAGSPRLLH